MFLSRNKKNTVYPCKPQFYNIKVVFKWSKLYRHVFVMKRANYYAFFGLLHVDRRTNKCIHFPGNLICRKQCRKMAKFRFVYTEKKISCVRCGAVCSLYDIVTARCEAFVMFCPVLCLIVLFDGSCLALWSSRRGRESWLLCFSSVSGMCTDAQSSLYTVLWLLYVEDNLEKKMAELIFVCTKCIVLGPVVQN